MFLLPLYGYYYTFFPVEFISSYLIDELQPKLAFVFDNSDREELKECIGLLQENEHFFSINDDENEIVVTLLVPKEFNIDINLFKIGRWSKLSEELKELLLDYRGRETGMGKQIMMIDALYPNQAGLKFRASSLGVEISDLVTGEVMSIPDISREIYRISKEFIKYEEQIRKEEEKKYAKCK